MSPPMASTSASPENIPAWQRLSLKLKSEMQRSSESALETTLKKRKLDDPEDTDSSEPGRARKRSKKEKKDKKDKKEKKGEKPPKEDEEVKEGEDKEEIRKRKKKEKKEKKEKKVKKAKKKIEEKGPQSNDSISIKVIEPASPPPAAILISVLKRPSASPDRTFSRKKSVTFTADTKTDDGDVIKTLYFALDPFGIYGTNENISSTSATTVAAAAPSKAKKPKKVEKKKTRKQEADPTQEEGYVKPQLSYLLSYHVSHDSWKFEKGKQNWILRHVFDTGEIPSSSPYDDALKSYIAGLQSSGARDRLLANAKKIIDPPKDEEIKKDAEDGEDKPAAKKEKKPAPVLTPGNQEARLGRAKLVMKALGHEDDEDEEMADESSSSESGSISSEDK